MIVIPAIDLKDGKCVRLFQGKAENETVYSDDPVKMAFKWKEAGATRIHVVDLDGAFSGIPKNLTAIVSIKKETGLMVEVGGGLRNPDIIDVLLDKEIDRVILGTILFTDTKLSETIFKKFGDKIMVGMDTKDGKIAIKGWKEEVPMTIETALTNVKNWGAQEIIFTDISRDGALQGVNIPAVQEIMKKTDLRVYASGGVSTMEDITALRKIKSPGCIVGKAIYDGRLDLKAAIQEAGR